mmetsp:Transcript_18629/g.25830  ORF Transcript_18629/g.25830 Transcript_18629/m.25830 type:complete len:587 (-) Transcript_18629:142-1902(-)|eukprot:CAMPEP_0196579128 /NCGR_PEP_ID=MMETSP1081-20130531/17664_1 /TAXON_ID=36882 /ORGANISM="Pyramimonas amylifera, Strain CCMP720" /LENGTH=586 /DNA_ID=CAMNT_0041898597 /DNA_START=93 /DNA_END=1853 /DNA_ORIENTATION=-
MAATHACAVIRTKAIYSRFENTRSLRKKHGSFSPVPQALVHLEGTFYRNQQSFKQTVLRTGLCNAGRSGRVVRKVSALGETEDLFKGTTQKALAINLDPSIYGSFAEIGAGQEVARWFFSVGGAAGTVAKSVSAYDMTISDSYYGQCERYVTQERLESMLEFEYVQCALPLRNARGKNTCFFAYANTVVARAYRRMNECHGWMGVKWQTSPGAEPSRLMIHMRMLDATAAEQQEALGVFGVNFIHTCFYKYKAIASHESDCKAALQSLVDDLSSQRIEVDFIRVDGPDFRETDNRVLALDLVDSGLTDAVLFNSSGQVTIPTDFLRKQNILIQRGNFRPPTILTADLINAAAQQMFCGLTAGDDGCVVKSDSRVLMEMTLADIRESGDGLDWTETHNDFLKRSARDFLDRVETINTMGYPCLVSNYFEYFKLAAYLRRSTREQVVICLGVPAVKQLFNENFYTQLEGGILENFGRLITAGLKIYVYPTWDAESQTLITADNLELLESVMPLYDFLYNKGVIEKMETYDIEVIKKYEALCAKAGVRDPVLNMIRSGAPGWEQFLTPEAANLVQKNKLFGLNSSFDMF